MRNVIGMAGIAVVVLGAGACSPAGEGGAGRAYIEIKGSDTMVHLVSTWVEHFMSEHPDIDVSVTGGGSGTGVAALINGTTDICMASRDLQAKEREQARAQGIEPVEIAVARDGIVVVVNPGNPVNELTLEQLRKIFTGAYTTWDQVGGPPEPIGVLSRESSSGTYMFFQEFVLNKQDYVASARLLPATSGIVQAVAADAWAIGYVGLGYAGESAASTKIIAVKSDPASEAVVPTEASVSSGAYPISRPLFLLTAGEPAGPVEAFLDYCLGPEGQAIVQESGYVPVVPREGSTP